MRKQYDHMFWFYDPNDYEKYIEHLTLKGEKILFEIIRPHAGSLSWAQFLKTVARSADLRKLIAAVLLDAFSQMMQKGELDFTPPNPPAAGAKPFVPLYTIELDAPFHKVFSARASAGILLEYIRFVEKLHCEHLTKSRGPGYSLADYFDEVEGSDVLMDELTYAFDDGINRIDIAASWTDEQVEMARRICGYCG